jgi:DNA polymerase III subunit gamma/tau
MTELHTKHRPTKWSEFIGHKAVVQSLKASLESGTSRTFLFTGEPGLGKTTLARLVARALGIDPDHDASNYVEYDGATNTGVDDMRAIMERARLQPLGGKAERVLVIDEAHMLSKSAWNSSLKAVEEPPPGVYWIFCTSEGSKVPASIRSRCQEFVLNEVPSSDLEKLLERVIEEEGFEVSDYAFDTVLEHANGCPRAALVALGQVASLKDDADIDRVLQGAAAAENADVIELCRALVQGAELRKLATIVGKLQGTVTAEGVRNVVCGYMAKCAGGRDTVRALQVIHSFATPYPAGIGSGLYPVYASLYQLDNQ